MLSFPPRWLVENKRGVVVSSIVGFVLVLVVVVAVVSSQGRAVPLPGGEIHKSIDWLYICQIRS